MADFGGDAKFVSIEKFNTLGVSLAVNDRYNSLLERK
jgi:hypothetical protein